jgi:hypothetical protein
MKLVIDKTWDGRPARQGEGLTLSLSGTATHLNIGVDAPFHGDPAPAGPAGPYWKLWEYEVVELFVLGAEEHYTEIELGPHGHHLVLRLEGRRNAVAQDLPMQFAASIGAEGKRWRGQAQLARTLLPAGPHRINAYAIHGIGAARRYLAWSPVPGEQPDFHNLDHFRSVTLP